MDESEEAAKKAAENPANFDRIQLGVSVFIIFSGVLTARPLRGLEHLSVFDQL
jgi:hypothetical protein